MTIRYCPRCKTDVEDTGGYCLLGHRLALEPPVASITDLRAEVDRAFEEARMEVAAVAAGGDDVPTSPMAALARPAPPPPPPPGTPQATPRAQETRTAPPPPPPPPPAAATSAETGVVPSEEEMRARGASVWKDLDRDDVDIVGDPIGAFAPPPHMDWGPERGKGLKRKPTRRPRRAAEATE